MTIYIERLWIGGGTVCRFGSVGFLSSNNAVRKKKVFIFIKVFFVFRRYLLKIIEKFKGDDTGHDESESYFQLNRKWNVKTYKSDKRKEEDTQ